MARLTITQFNDIQQDHLTKLLSGYLVQHHVGMQNLRQHLKSIRQPFIACEGVLRLTQTIVNQLPENFLIQDIYRIYEDFFIRLSIPPYELANKLLSLFESVYSLSMENLRTMRNVCLVAAIVGEIYEKEDYSLEGATLEKMINLLTKIVKECEHDETVLYALMALDKWLRRQKPVEEDENSKTNPGISDELAQALAPLCAYLEECKQANYELPNLEQNRFRLAFIARWLLSNYRSLVENDHQNLIEKPTIKISACGLLAGNAHIQYNQYPVKSAYPVRNMAGTFYYEVILLTSGDVEVGWSTREAKIATYSNKSPYALLLSRETGQFHYKSSSSKCPRNWARWAPGDVLGCLIDATEGRFAFYLNGRKIACPLKKVRYSTQPYYASALIGEQSCCYFNFGQLPFAFEPSLPADCVQHISSFHQITDGQVEVYRLLHPQNSSYEFWFKQPTVLEDQLYFTIDEAQSNFNLWVVQVRSALEAHLPERDPTIKALKSVIKEMLKEAGGINCLRLTQALIQVSAADESFVESEILIEVLIEWINQWAFREGDDNWDGSKTLEFCYFYMQLPATNPRRRSLLALLSTCRLYVFSSEAFKTREIFRSVIRDALEQENKWTLRIASACLSPLINSSTIFDPYLNNTANVRELKVQIVRLAEKFSAQLQAESLYNFNYSSLKRERFMLGFNAQTALHLLSTTLPSTSADVDGFFEQLVHFGDGFAVANCSQVRVTAMSAYKCVDVADKCYYYETILLSLDSIIVGWASRASGFNRDHGLGHDARSIGFEANDPSIYNDAITQIPELASAKTGSVVGCLLDGGSRRFAFYLDGERVRLPQNVQYFDQYSYFAAVTLNPGQKCYLNFGQLPFKYAPNDVENFVSFHAATDGNAARYRLIGSNVAG